MAVVMLSARLIELLLVKCDSSDRMSDMTLRSMENCYCVQKLSLVEDTLHRGRKCVHCSNKKITKSKNNRSYSVSFRHS
jgi:hypothetical protein